MKIYDISITNFRGIKNLQNLKVGDINSFVGKNDSGKSNIHKLKTAGSFLDIEVHDHLIITNEGYFSFADEGMM